MQFLRGGCTVVSGYQHKVGASLDICTEKHTELHSQLSLRIAVKDIIYLHKLRMSMLCNAVIKSVAGLISCFLSI